MGVRRGGPSTVQVLLRSHKDPRRQAWSPRSARRGHLVKGTELASRAVVSKMPPICQPPRPPRLRQASGGGNHLGSRGTLLLTQCGWEAKGGRTPVRRASSEGHTHHRWKGRKLNTSCSHTSQQHPLTWDNPRKAVTAKTPVRFKTNTILKGLSVQEKMHGEKDTLK